MLSGVVEGGRAGMAGLEGKTASVIGSTRGIGKVIALELAAPGCDVVIADHGAMNNPETTARVIALIRAGPMSYTGQILTSRAFFDEHKLG